MRLRILFNRIFPPFREWESRLLDFIAKSLPPQLSPIFEQQVREVNFVQRLQGGREINLYRMQRDLPNISRSPRIETPAEEYLLATAIVEQRQGRIRCEVWIVCGLVFSIRCNRIPASRVSGEVKNVKIFPPSSGRNPILDLVNEKLRSEFESLVAVKCLFGGGVRLFEPHMLRHMMLESQSYCVFGESINAELLMAPCDETKQSLVFLNSELGTIRPASNSFAKLLKG